MTQIITEVHKPPLVQGHVAVYYTVCSNDKWNKLRLLRTSVVYNLHVQLEAAGLL